MSRTRAEALVIDLLIFAYLILATSWFVTHQLELKSAVLWSIPSLGLAMILGGALTLAIRGRGVSLGEFISGRSINDEDSTNPMLWTSLVFVVCTFVVGWAVTGASLTDLFSSEGFQGAARIFRQMFQPNMAILPRALAAIVETVFIAFMATFLALPIAFLLSFFASANIMNTGFLSKFVYVALRTIMNFSRSIEPIIWAIVFSVWVGIGPFAGMLALWLHSIVSLVKLYSEQIESIDVGPVEGLESVGANRVQVVTFGVVPQVVLPFISYTIYRWDINVRMATIVGLVGGGGIGTLLMQYQGQGRWNEVGVLIFLIAIVVWAMDQLSARLRKYIA